MNFKPKQPLCSSLRAFSSSVSTPGNGVGLDLFQPVLTDVRSTFHNGNFTLLRAVQSRLLSSFVCGCCPGSESRVLVHCCITCFRGGENQFCVPLHMIASAFLLGCEQQVQSTALSKALLFPQYLGSPVRT